MTKHEAYAELIVSTVQKALAPALASLKAFGERLTAVEARPAVSPVESELRETLAALRERMAVMETKSASLPAPVELDLHPILARLQSAESALEAIKAEGLWHAGIQPMLADARERIAALEARPQLAGPPGEPGPPGKDGADGKDGSPGLEWKGIYNDEKTYEPGQIAKWGGSTYVCMKTTTGVKPDAMPQRLVGADGDSEYRGVSGKDFWELFVSKGDPGKQGRDGQNLIPLPVVKVGGAR